MHHVILKAAAIADQAGCYAIVLDVMSDGTNADFRTRKDWYAEFGFQTFASNSSRMFMTMKQVRNLVEK